MKNLCLGLLIPYSLFASDQALQISDSQQDLKKKEEVIIFTCNMASEKLEKIYATKKKHSSKEREEEYKNLLLSILNTNQTLCKATFAQFAEQQESIEKLKKENNNLLERLTKLEIEMCQVKEANKSLIAMKERRQKQNEGRAAWRSKAID